MGTEHDSHEERNPLGDEPSQAPPAEQLEEENPVESPAQPADGENQTDRDSARERASTSMGSQSQSAKSTEGLTVGGTEKTRSE
jgi:hypothetical protein